MFRLLLLLMLLLLLLPLPPPAIPRDRPGMVGLLVDGLETPTPRLTVTVPPPLVLLLLLLSGGDTSHSIAGWGFQHCRNFPRYIARRSQ